VEHLPGVSHNDTRHISLLEIVDLRERHVSELADDEELEGAFGGDIDYAMLVKVYGAAPEGQRRYSPAICTGAHKYRVEGNPDPKHVSTSFVERSNLSIRMGNRRMTRLTNAFSKKAENHAHMMAIYFMHYNFVRIHQTLKVTPAMAAEVTPKLWEMSDTNGPSC
jgi:hypothetical protein